MITLKNINKKYDREILKDVNLVINDGEFVAILGKSGSGKTTLLNIIGGLTSFEGEYIFNSTNVKEIKELSMFRRNFGFVFQKFYLDEDYSVYENIELPLIISKKKDYSIKIKNVIDYVGLNELSKTKCKKISGGEAQRVAIARAIVNDADFILADEPTGSLDSINKKNIMELLKKLNKEGKTIILVTHDMDDAKYANRIINIIDGKIHENNI